MSLLQNLEKPLISIQTGQRGYHAGSSTSQVFLDLYSRHTDNLRFLDFKISPTDNLKIFKSFPRFFVDNIHQNKNC